MSTPIIGSTWGITPERQTLTEARKRVSGRSLWFRALFASARNSILARVGVHK